MRVAPRRLRRRLGVVAAGCALVAGAATVAAIVPGSQLGTPTGRDQAGEASERVRVGVEMLLSDSSHLVRGKRIGLITNHTGVIPETAAMSPEDPGGPSLRSTIDVLHQTPGVELTALFGPEHGLRGDREAGEKVQDGVDPATGVRIHSLYGAVRRPPSQSLEELDVLVFDMQDVGARYYTYVSTMALAMEAAGDAGIPFVVLDRPNPIGGVAVQGNILDPRFASFVGMYPVPMRHGMTVGELARAYVGEFGLEVDLRVVPMQGWRREYGFADTELPWVPPSPNMPSEASALLYPGTCLFEGTPLSVGRGTRLAFQWIGAPWIDAEALATALDRYDIPGVRFEPASFTPQGPGDDKFDGERVHGVRFVATSAEIDAPRAAVAALIEARTLSGDRWSWREGHFDRLAGTDRLRLGIEAGQTLSELTREWDEGAGEFRRRVAGYLLY